MTRSRVLVITIAAGVAAGLLLSPHAWLGDRSYPVAPVWRQLGPLPRSINVSLYSTLLFALGAAAIAAKPERWLAGAVGLGVVFVCFDQSRLQPWFYQYLVMLGAFAVCGVRRDGPEDADEALNVCRLVTVCIYIWSGLAKANADFVWNTFPSLIAPISRFLPPSLVSVSHSLGFLAPLTEIGIGCGLLSRRFRTAAVLGALGVHALLLFCLGPLGWNYNSVVWPWNLAMAAIVVLLFWRTPGVTASQIIRPRRRAFHAMVLLLFGIAPALSFVNLWDQYLSFGLYARPRSEMTLRVTDDLANRLPNEVLRYVHPTDIPRIYVIDVPEWSLSELNLTIYPEPRVYRAVGRFICSFAQQTSDDMRMAIRERRLLSPDGHVEYTCAAVR